MMKRDEMLKAFARQRKDEIVVAVYMAAQEITHISPSDLNYTFVGAMGQGSSHLLEVVVLATCTDALLRGRGAPVPLRRRLLTEEDLLELDHTGVGEEQRRVVAWDERGGGPDGVRLPGEVVEEAFPDFGGSHIVVS